MRLDNKFFTFLCLLLFFVSVQSLQAKKRNHTPENEILLRRLDSLVANNQSVIQAKENKISQLRNDLKIAFTPEKKFNLSRSLYSEYQVYDSDSALHYSLLSAQLLKETDIHDYNIEAAVKIEEAFSQAVQGRFAISENILREIDPARLNQPTLTLYYQSWEYLFYLTSIYFQEYKKDKEIAIKNSIEYIDSINCLYPGGDDMLPWAPLAWKLRNKEMGKNYVLNDNDSDFLTLKTLVDSPQEPSRLAATNAYWISRYYAMKGDRENQIHYLAIASIYDALIANREISALEELAGILFEDEELNRAFNYLSFALDEVSLYKNSAKTGSISRVLNVVRNAYEEEIHQRDRDLHHLVVALVIVAAVLLFSLFFLLLEHRKKLKMQKRVSSVNESLESTIKDRDKAIEELRETNEKLMAVNQRNVGLLAFIIRISSDFLGSFENYRNSLLVKFKGKQISDLDSMLNNPEVLKSQYQNFYSHLDKTLLSVIPDFMTEYNKTAPADQQMTSEDLRKSSLNTRMRIFGLQKLGIEKSAEIAKMLNISIRTVYNNR